MLHRWAKKWKLRGFTRWPHGTQLESGEPGLGPQSPLSSCAFGHRALPGVASGALCPPVLFLPPWLPSSASPAAPSTCRCPGTRPPYAPFPGDRPQSRELKGSVSQRSGAASPALVPAPGTLGAGLSLTLALSASPTSEGLGHPGPPHLWLAVQPWLLCPHNGLCGDAHRCVPHCVPGPGHRGPPCRRPVPPLLLLDPLSLPPVCAPTRRLRLSEVGVSAGLGSGGPFTRPDPVTWGAQSLVSLGQLAAPAFSGGGDTQPLIPRRSLWVQCSCPLYPPCVPTPCSTLSSVSGFLFLLSICRRPDFVGVLCVPRASASGPRV